MCASPHTRYTDKIYRTYRRLSTAIALVAALVIPTTISFNELHSSEAEAVQLRDGKTYFLQLPTLLGAETTVNRVYASYAVYYFTLTLPQNLGEPLQKLEILQTEGFDRIDFRDQVIAFLADEAGERVQIPVKLDIAERNGRNQVTVTFDPPIAANSLIANRRLVVGLRPIHNPRYDGVYLFSVIALPLGDRPHSQFLGYGRLNFYDFRR